MERKEAIRSAYRLTGGNNFYDGMITCTTLSGKAVCRLVWDMNKAECDAYLEKALSGIEDHYKYRDAVMQAYPHGNFPVFEGHDHMQYQIRDPKGFAEMLCFIAEHDRMPELEFIQK